MILRPKKDNNMNANTTRFSDRVEDYVKYRPAYPLEMLEMLRSEIGFNKDFVIADIGSGTGITSVLFLKNGNTVFAVEPNKEMREAAELKFAGNPNFISVDGSAEHSTLKGESIDVIFCGQAFHWFDRIPAKKEFTRILKKTGHIILAWNDRNVRDKFQQE
jgi:ubiquinone/menaquinone biosynthesis C-methylase UbiE